MQQQLQHLLLVVLRPAADGKFCDLQLSGTQPGNVAIHSIAIGSDVGNCALEVLVLGDLVDSTHQVGYR